MIEQNSNIIKDPKIKRIVEYSADSKQINVLDSRFYSRNGKYYPSVTYVLGYYPKGKFFENWLKQVGFSADYIVKKAAEEGTQVHELAEAYLNGEELNFLDERGRPQYNPDVWQMFLRFVEFWELYNPKLIETEVHLFSDELKVAGTCDLVCEIDGEIWIIDFKTHTEHDKYQQQLNRYAEALHILYPQYQISCGLFYLLNNQIIKLQKVLTDT